MVKAGELEVTATPAPAGMHEFVNHPAPGIHCLASLFCGWVSGVTVVGGCGGWCGATKGGKCGMGVGDSWGFDYWNHARRFPAMSQNFFLWALLNICRFLADCCSFSFFVFPQERTLLFGPGVRRGRGGHRRPSKSKKCHLNVHMWEFLCRSRDVV